MQPDQDDFQPRLEHVPVRPARPGCLGENIFLAQWVELVTADGGFHPDYDDANGRLHSILLPGDGILTQRHATVAASMMRWLGTNNGQEVLRKADHMADKLRNRPDGFVSAWALECRRVPSVNSGMNGPDCVMMSADGDRPEKLSADDLEVMSGLMEWLGTDSSFSMMSGQAFLRKCRVLIAAELQAESRRRRAANGETILLSPEGNELFPVDYAQIEKDLVSVWGSLPPEQLRTMATYVGEGYTVERPAANGSYDMIKTVGDEAHRLYVRADGASRQENSIPWRIKTRNEQV